MWYSLHELGAIFFFLGFNHLINRTASWFCWRVQWMVVDGIMLHHLVSQHRCHFLMVMAMSKEMVSCINHKNTLFLLVFHPSRIYDLFNLFEKNNVILFVPTHLYKSTNKNHIELFQPSRSYHKREMLQPIGTLAANQNLRVLNANKLP